MFEWRARLDELHSHPSRTETKKKNTLFVSQAFQRVSLFQSKRWETSDLSWRRLTCKHSPELVLRTSLDGVFPRCISDAAELQRTHTLICLSLIRMLRESALDTTDKREYFKTF